MNIKALLIGNLTIDHNITESGKYSGPGGTAYFCAKTFENLGIETTVVSPYGKDFPKRHISKAIFVPQNPGSSKTLTFRNVRRGNIRRQWVYNQDERHNIFDTDNLKDIYDIVIIAPVINNISYKQVVRWRKQFLSSLFILIPQGFCREILSDGMIQQNICRDMDKMISLADIAVLSDDDIVDAQAHAIDWSGQKVLIIVTQEDKGCTYYRDGRGVSVDAFRIDDVVDSTGAGDIFTAGFALSFYLSNDLRQSAVFANACAGLSLRFVPDKLKYTYKDIMHLIQLEGRAKEYEYNQ